MGKKDNKMAKKEFVTIKIKKGVYDSLFELKKTLIQQGYNNFPKEFLDFLDKENFDITKVSYANMISLTNKAILFLLRDK